ncbi:MAG: flagellar export protein FliJ [Zoogloeaceae bacterium]|jgi:flagellar FliJ protein|nr:flagellar export protein FliJ [Zoogloeaceae bacterium]
MPPTFFLQPLLDLMRERVDEATRKLGEFIAAEQNAKKRLELILQYREEYAARFVAAQKAGLTAREYQNYQEFLAQIEEAVRQQTMLVGRSEQDTADGQARWQEQNTRMKAIDALAVRHEKAEERRALKQEQKDHDEISAIKQHRKRND